MTVKRPYVREWYHEGGDDTYSQKLATKTMIAKAVEAKKKGHDVVVVTSGRVLKGKEYTPQSWLDKYPKWKLKKPKPKAKPKAKTKTTAKKKTRKCPKCGK